MQIRVYSEPGSNPLLEKMRLVCGQRTADKEKGGKRDFAERRRHCLCLKAVGCQLGSVRALPFSQDTFLPALPAVLKQRAAKVLISGIDWGRAGHLRSDRGRYPRAEHNLGRGVTEGLGCTPCSCCLAGKTSPRLNFVNTASAAAKASIPTGRESWQRHSAGIAQPSPVPASPSPANKQPCRKQKERRIPPFPLRQGCGARGMRCGIGRDTETPLGEKQQKYLLNSSVNVQINTFGPVSGGGRSHLATAGLSPDLFPVSIRAEIQVYPTQPSHRCLTVWCPRSSVSHCTLILGRSLL